MTTDRTPVIAVSRRGADRIRAGHVWVYRSDVINANGAEPGAVVLVQEDAPSAGRRHADTRVSTTRKLSDKNVRPTRPPVTRTLGSAFYSTASEIAIRMISPKPVKDVGQLIRERVRAAISYRERFVQDTNAYRVIFSEGDFLPGLIVDKYNDILSLQVLTQAWDPDPMRNIFLSELRVALNPRVIVERIDPRVRKLEQLPERESGTVWPGNSPKYSNHEDSFKYSNHDVSPNRFSGEEPGVPGREAGSSSFRSAPLLGMTSGERGATGASPVEG